MVNWIAGNWPGGSVCPGNDDGILDYRMMPRITEERRFAEWEFGDPALRGSGRPQTP